MGIYYVTDVCYIIVFCLVKWNEYVHVINTSAGTSTLDCVKPCVGWNVYERLKTELDAQDTDLDVDSYIKQPLSHIWFTFNYEFDAAGTYQ